MRARDAASLAAAHELLDLLAATAESRYTTGQGEQEALLKAVGAGIRALREVSAVSFVGGCARWRDELWHARSLALFPGASACVMTSVAVAAVEQRAMALQELFAA